MTFRVPIPIHNSHNYDSIPRNKDLKQKIIYDCEEPAKTLIVDWQGECYVCPCELWLPITVGNIDDFSRLEDVWQSPIAQALQKDVMIKKKMTHCAVDRCGILERDRRVEKYQVSINIDQSCNLRCPSCRKSHIMITEGPDFEIKSKRARHIVNLLENFDQPCHIIMTGNGDPLASAIMRPLIHAWRPRKDHSIRLFTNGLLLEKQLDNNPILDSITEYMISIDAGSAEVYEKVRLGGSWQQLLKNFDWLKKQSMHRSFKVMIQFVLQKENYQDLDNFCQLIDRYGFGASITHLENWSTWSDFSEEDVIGNKAHRFHQHAMHLLRVACERYHENSIGGIYFAPKLRELIDHT